MATSIKDIELSNKRLTEILDIANDWSLCHGISILDSGDAENDGKKAITAPFSLFPSVVPAQILRQAQKSMKHFNLLMHKVALDHSFLENSLKNVIQADDFMKRLWDIYLQVREVGIKQPFYFGLFRNDFMMNCLKSITAGDLVTADQLELKQIEFNAISSSFAGLTEQISELHRLTLIMVGKKFESQQLPENKPATGFAEGLAKAWELYGNANAVILYIVSGNERNVIDQRWLEFQLYETHPHITVLRKTFLDINNLGVLDSNSVLTVNGMEVAVVYLRDGYTAENYSSEEEWNGRLKLELSTAIKCPSIQYQLMGSKKIQQELARPGAVERFISDASVVQDLRRTFADLYSLDLGPEGDEAVEKALASPEKFVLKPQREGGGHNLYSEDITKFFTLHRNSKQREGYILMQRIFPWQQKNYLVKRGVPFQLSDVVSELGIYGVYIGSAEQEIANYQCGHMMRTKITGTDEGGVVAGFAVLDTPFVID
ncbi:glutathione synthetase [Biomphalaria pfeifferi]|uniref:Glutathione synthetase n=1 Tax=Biomphalaria pfeifferi TaxID=112525 RepID=A0AAD8EYJ1_BIOPF|nr:glutathione synthetase [Biomphalaria pfeifferi]